MARCRSHIGIVSKRMNGPSQLHWRIFDVQQCGWFRLPDSQHYPCSVQYHLLPQVNGNTRLCHKPRLLASGKC